MRTLHLFAGSGGGLLADLILGHKPIGAVEIDPYCCSVLRERAADGWWPGLRVHEQDIRLFDPSEYAGRVDCVSGGFPCQDISAAGRGAGITGERSGLWSEFARVIRLVRPRYAFIENSPMLTSRGLDVVLSDLAALGFDAQWAVVSAADAGAPHQRERIWILADANSEQRRPSGMGKNTRPDRRNNAGRRGESKPSVMANPSSPRSFPAAQAGVHRSEESAGAWNEQPERYGSDVSNTESREQERRRNWPRWRQRSAQQSELQPGTWSWWQSESDVGRVADGVAHRVHRLKALGNGQVPQQAALAWRILEGMLN